MVPWNRNHVASLYVLTPRKNEFHYREGKDGGADLRAEGTSLLSYLLDRYHPFVELEIHQTWFADLDIDPWWYSTRNMPWEKTRWLGYTPLMLAVVAGDPRLVKLLIQSSANVT